MCVLQSLPPTGLFLVPGGQGPDKKLVVSQAGSGPGGEGNVTAAAGVIGYRAEKGRSRADKGRGTVP
jgi:hypothetical protein